MDENLKKEILYYAKKVGGTRFESRDVDALKSRLYTVGTMTHDPEALPFLLDVLNGPRIAQGAHQTLANAISNFGDDQVLEALIRAYSVQLQGVDIGPFFKHKQRVLARLTTDLAAYGSGGRILLSSFDRLNSTICSTLPWARISTRRSRPHNF